MLDAGTSRKLLAEALGTAFLLATVIGSGIMADNLAGGNAAIALLGNTIPTGAILVVLILVFGPVSGAHFNPAVSIAFLLRRQLTLPLCVAYITMQVIGGLAGMVAAHAMFDLDLVQISSTGRATANLWFSELIACFGLVFVIFGALRGAPTAVPYVVGLYITAAYWFTASTSFANPAVTIARAFTDTFTGIAPAGVPGFIIAQIIGAVLAVLLAGWLFADPAKSDT